MAEAFRYVCDGCGHTVDAWSDGNPYFIDEAGEKQYAYHPDHERLALCIGNDSPHLCLACGVEFMVDSRAPTAVCPECGTAKIAATYRLAGLRCPYCKEGVFQQDPDFYAIS
jgi:DNA-directed RNA polymerase subunit RPC12/RpoP